MNLDQLTKEQKLQLIYRHTHRDFKGSSEGVRTILVLRGSTHCVSLDGLTDAEIADRLPYAISQERKRRAKKNPENPVNPV
jgi:hypothetical protein